MGGGYCTAGGSATEAANDVRFLLEKLDEIAGWRNELGHRFNAEKQKTNDLSEALEEVRKHNQAVDKHLLREQWKRFKS